MKLSVIDFNKGAAKGDLNLNPSVWGAEANTHLMHLALVRQDANGRAGTADTKTRSEVSGGGRKPWKQKGTGRARQGSIRATQWVGGGISHGPTPRKYTKDMPKSARKAAIVSALSACHRDGNLVVVEEFQLKAPKTAEISAFLERAKLEGRVLLVDAVQNEVLSKSSRNICNVKAISVGNLNVRDLLLADKVVLTKNAVSKIEEGMA